MNTPQPQIKSPQDSDTVITAQDLLLALEEKRNEFKVDRWSIISEIIDARRQIEMYEGGGYGKYLCSLVRKIVDRGQILTLSFTCPTSASVLDRQEKMVKAMQTTTTSLHQND